jgi:hypothetical protein
MELVLAVGAALAVIAVMMFVIYFAVRSEQRGGGGAHA